MKANLHALSQSLGLSPTTADLQAASEKRQQDLVAARQNTQDMTVARDAAYDTGTPAAIQKATAALADAEITEGKAQLAWAASQRTLAASLEAEQSKTKQAARAALSKATATYDKAAIALDDLALQMAKHAATIDAQYSAFNESRSAGAGGYFTPVSGSTLAKLALDRAVAAQAGEWIESRPSAKDAAARVVGAVMAVTA